MRFYSAPIVTFNLNIISMLLFLALFSVVTVKGLRKYPGWEEIVLMYWCFTLFLEEIRQFIISESSCGRRFSAYFANRWNWVDLAAIVLVLIGFILRWVPCQDVLRWAHVSYVVALICYFLRFTSVFSRSTYLGPKLVSVFKMVSDVIFFFFIALVFLVAYGVAFQSLIYPGIEHSVPTFVWGFFLRPFFEMLGEPHYLIGEPKTAKNVKEKSNAAETATNLSRNQLTIQKIPKLAS
ncbi:transient receptor potential cation channel subfamily M member 2-like [Symsagittifera roscoffensis]|uniref:transient receptor potential cation channel subfamily M member 2-like n=1 Tax=Symsagittifera roscoffensis TaxID=84072 RepID=UPI00307B905F